jgi:Fe-S cluster assembly ATP-binding protein
MITSLLKIQDLQTTVEGLLVVDGLNWEIGYGETHVIMGKNGSGKSSLAMTLMGDARYKTLDSSCVLLEAKDLLKMSPDERARAGLYVAWQNPIAIPGVSVFSLCKANYESRGNKIDKLTDFKRKLEGIASRVGLTKEHIGRSVNEGFSGGERKRLEILQLLLIYPKLAILDEIDSGLDTEGLKMVAEVVGEMKQKGTSFVLITHNKRVLEDIEVDNTWEMKHGQLQARV